MLTVLMGALSWWATHVVDRILARGLGLELRLGGADPLQPALLVGDPFLMSSNEHKEATRQMLSTNLKSKPVNSVPHKQGLPTLGRV
jgi:hypothetical protein